MIPTEVKEIADLIWPDWIANLDEDGRFKKMADNTLAAAWRIYNAGYRCEEDPDSSYVRKTE